MDCLLCVLVVAEQIARNCMADGRLFHSPRRAESPMADAPSAEDVNGGGNIIVGPLAHM